MSKTNKTSKSQKDNKQHGFPPKILQQIDNDLYLYGIYDVLFKSLNSFFNDLTIMVIVLMKDKNHMFLTSTASIPEEKEAEIYNKWNNIVKDKEINKKIEAIIYFDKKTESINRFIDNIVKKIKKEQLIQLVKSNNILPHLLTNYKVFFIKHKEVSQFDWKI